MAASEKLVADVKNYLRVTATAFDAEVADLIESAKADLLLSGINPDKVENEDDPLIRRAITVYVKSEFGVDNPDAEKYAQSYVMLKTHLMLSAEYGGC